MAMWKEAGVKVIPVVASVAWQNGWSAAELTPWWQKEAKQADTLEKTQQWYWFRR